MILTLLQLSPTAPDWFVWAFAYFVVGFVTSMMVDHDEGDESDICCILLWPLVLPIFAIITFCMAYEALLRFKASITYSKGGFRGLWKRLRTLNKKPS